MKSYITLLSTDNYLPGVLVLYRSLLAVGSEYPLCCLLSSSVSRDAEERLVAEGIACIRLSRSTMAENTAVMNERYSNWNYSFDKLRVWGLTQFQKIVFLDSDMLVMRNLDHLFQYAPFSGVIAGKSLPMGKDWREVNSGLLVIVPDTKVEAELIKRLPRVLKSFEQAGKPVGDQDVLNDYLSVEWQQNHSLHLDEGYNIFADYLSHYIQKLGYSFEETAEKPIYVVHFIGKYKPWMKPTLRNMAWLMKQMFASPHYFHAFRKFRSYL